MKHHSERALALDVHPLSFGYCVFEGPDHLIDWGVRSFRRGVNAVKIPMRTKLAWLVDEYQPDIILVITPKTVSPPLHVIRKVASSAHVQMRLIRHKSFTVGFSDSHNKHELALAIARRLPSLLPYIPPKRKPWKPEHYRTSIFTAAAIGLLHYDGIASGNRSQI